MEETVIEYRGCKIIISCEESLGGWQQYYYSAYSPSGYEICCDYTASTNKQDPLTYVSFAVDEFFDIFHGNEDLHSETSYSD